MLAALWLVPVGIEGPTLVATAAFGGWLAGWRGAGWPLWLVGGLAWTLLTIDAALEQRLPVSMSGPDLVVRGWIDDFPSHASGRVTFSLQVVPSSGHERVARRLRLTWYDPPFELAAAMGLELTVRLRTPHGFANPGGFDYERWLFLEGIDATGYVRGGQLGDIRADRIARAWLSLRASIAARIAAAVSSQDARALLTALVIGERGGFEDRHWSVLRRTGTSHLVAISGLHVGIVGAWLFFIVRWLCLRGPAALAAFDLEIASLLSGLGAAFYSALAGFPVSTQRALLMLAVALGLIVARRAPTTAASLAIAAIVVTAWDPLSTLTSGFWLSFAAVVILCQMHHGTTPVVGLARAWLRRLSRATRTQWGVTLGLLPLVVAAFGEISVIAPLVNLIAIPLFGLLIVPMALAGLVALPLGPLGDRIFAAAAALSELSFSALTGIAAFEWATLRVPELPAQSIGLLALGTAIVSLAAPLPGRSLGWLAVVGAVSSGPASPPTGSMRATVLDVGHGLAVVVRTARHTLLYDAGARFRSGFDTGRDIVVPALRATGVKRVDRVIVSHADNDHAGGLSAVMDAYPAASLLAGADVAHAGATRCAREQRWRWDGVEFEMLHPGADATLPGNDGSCVLRISASVGTMLLPGDLERRGEQSLLDAVQSLAADIVIVPHHGSATSSSLRFVTATHPQYAIVSAGFANRWGFPNDAVVQRWHDVGATVLTTGTLGAIAIDFGERDIAVSAQRWRWQRAWMAAH